jgi:hypothetical protein
MKNVWHTEKRWIEPSFVAALRQLLGSGSLRIHNSMSVL